MFEYPSEESLSEEVSTTAPSPVSSPPAIPLVGSTLSSYTPSKSSTNDTFELGVTRTTSATTTSQQSSQQQNSETNSSDNTAETPDYFKPVDTDNEITWSQENTSDILF
ncbi:hypothetical protein O3M35_004716 [Rhynocoris fuscipes]|uniref:Uncharacterized protein n=1 Tax=Rhynocoris fuscipes TaxID=488301 RepID=A0AAW1CM98_9HEMI